MTSMMGSLSPEFSSLPIFMSICQKGNNGCGPKWENNY